MFHYISFITFLSFYELKSYSFLTVGWTFIVQILRSEAILLINPEGL